MLKPGWDNSGNYCAAEPATLATPLHRLDRDKGDMAPYFTPATAFAGVRPGTHFKLGPQGLGYYADGAAHTARGYNADGGGHIAPGFTPAATFAGMRPGTHFKMGPQGLGYYADDGAWDLAAGKTPGSVQQRKLCLKAVKRR